MTIGWRDTWPGVLKKTAVRWTAQRYWRDHSRVRTGLHLPTLKHRPGTVWGIAMVKNEADILDHVVQHLFEQGIDQLLVVDNNSSDGTPELLRELATTYPIGVGTDTETGYFQDQKMSALAAYARRSGASWVIPFDADEFWFASGTTVADFLRGANGSRVEADIFNVFPTRDNPSPTGLNGRLRLDLRPHLMRKVAAQTHPLLWIGMGNHSALRPGLSVGGLSIAHLPWRSEKQLARKLRQGARAYRATDRKTLGGHWKTLGQVSDERLHAIWSDLLNGDAAPALGWHPVGPFLETDLSSWATWDPEHQLPHNLEPQRPTF